jgi:aryl-alcohol dehydrogenase-like predicted oxidoreductase
MTRNRLGRSGLQVSPLSLGSYHVYDRLPFDDVVELLRTAHAAGVNWFDVGHYTSGAFPEARVSDTDIKFGWAREAAGIAREDYVHTEKVWYGGPRPTFKAQMAESLPRARVDYADIAIYNAGSAYHAGETVDMRNVATQMAGLIEVGWTRHWGINLAWPAEVREVCEFAAAEGLPLPTVMQIPYSAIARDMAEDPELAPVLEEFDIAVQATNSLAVGVLAGRPPAQATRIVGQEWLTDWAVGVIEEFGALADAAGATKAQLALAFALTGPRVASVLAGTSSLAQLRDNLGALDLLERLGPAGVRAAVADLTQHPDQAQVGAVYPS